MKLPLQSRALPSPLSRSGPIRFFTSLLAVGAFASAIGRAQVYNGTFDFQEANMINQTTTSFTWDGGGFSNPVAFTSQGLSLTYTAFGGRDQVGVTNVSDITGGGIQLNRYLSFVIGPATIAALAGYTGDYSVELTELYSRSPTHYGAEASEHFEIRTSADNFANPLAGWMGSNGDNNEPDYTAAGVIIPPTGRIDPNVITSNAPLEVRLYLWYDSPGGDGVAGRNPSTALAADIMRFRYEVTAIPEPSAALLLGTAGLLPLLRRRRMACSPTTVL